MPRVLKEEMSEISDSWGTWTATEGISAENIVPESFKQEPEDSEESGGDKARTQENAQPLQFHNWQGSEGGTVGSEAEVDGGAGSSSWLRNHWQGWWSTSGRDQQSQDLVQRHALHGRLEGHGGGQL